MSAPNEPTAPRIHIRIDTIADVVFGLALEIGSLALVGKLPQSGAAIAGDVVAFGFSFVIIFMAWFAYRRLVTALPHETDAVLAVTLALLFCVSIEPFLFYLLLVGAGSVSEAASVGFSLDIGTMMLLLASLHRLLVQEERLHPVSKAGPQALDWLRRTANGRVLAGVIFLAAALPFFSTQWPFGFLLRQLVWCVGLAVFLIARRRYFLRSGS
jgi:uncharacterized membrane protein